MFSGTRSSSTLTGVVARLSATATGRAQVMIMTRIVMMMMIVIMMMTMMMMIVMMMIVMRITMMMLYLRSTVSLVPSSVMAA